MSGTRDLTVTLDCPVCTVPFHPWKGRPGLTCSRTCANTHRARLTAEQRGDKLRDTGDGKGYRKRGGRHEHRVIAEQNLGRPLAPGETVHHQDEDRRNNTPTNLHVMASQADHARHHRTGATCPARCSCGRHTPYERTPMHRQLMSAAVAQARGVDR